MLNKIYMFILKWVAKKIIVQSSTHKEDIINVYKVVVDSARNTFYDTNKIHLDCFLFDCHQKALHEYYIED